MKRCLGCKLLADGLLCKGCKADLDALKHQMPDGGWLAAWWTGVKPSPSYKGGAQ